MFENVCISFDGPLKVKCHNADVSAKQKKSFYEFEELEGPVVGQEHQDQEGSAETRPMLAFPNGATLLRRTR